jgi:Family of unknown function (DUF5995)
MPEKRAFRHARLVAAVVGAVAAPLLVTGVGVSPARAELPYVAWSAYLPGWTEEYIPSSENDCVAGRAVCLKQTRKEFGRILEETARSCHHNAVFAMTYTRITQTYGWSRDIPGYYQDVSYINHMDAVFARYYTDAYYAYQAGARDEVPLAWQKAFDAARDKRATATGDLLLGINAHVNRDLPFVLAGMGLVRPDGQSGKPDFDKANDFLNAASDAMMAELAARFDPKVDDVKDPLGVAYGTVMQMLTTMREGAWRNAEALVNAPSAQARALVARTIESEAAAFADTILLLQSYTPPLTSTAPRDAYCAAHKGDAAPVAYPFGTPSPYAG